MFIKSRTSFLKGGALPAGLKNYTEAVTGLEGMCVGVFEASTPYVQHRLQTCSTSKENCNLPTLDTTQLLNTHPVTKWCDFTFISKLEKIYKTYSVLTCDP